MDETTTCAVIWGWMGDVHALAKPLFIALIAAHGGAALFHHFVLKDRVLRNMIVPAEGMVADDRTQS